MVDRATGKPQTKGSAKQPKGRIRRAELRRQPVQSAIRWLRQLAAHPASVPNVGTAVVFAILCTAIFFVSARTLPYTSGRTASETVVARTDFSVVNDAATQARKRDADATAERFYVAEPSALESLETALTTLPATLAAAGDLESLTPEIGTAFGITSDEQITTIAQSAEGTLAERWASRVRYLMDKLRSTPVLSNKQVQLVTSTGSGRLRVVLPDGSTDPVDAEDIIPFEPAGAAVERLAKFARDAGFQPAAANAIAVRALSAAPTHNYDQERTERDLRAKRAAVADVVDEYVAGTPIVLRGTPITEDHLRVLRAEADAARSAGGSVMVFLSTLAPLVFSLAFSLTLVAYLARYRRRALANPWRFLAFHAVAILALGIVLWVQSAEPAFLPFALTFAVTLTAMVFVTAYARRLAACISGGTLLLVTLAFGLSATQLIAIAAPVVIALIMLADVRSRAHVVRAAAGTSAVALAANLIAPLLEGPLSRAPIGEYLTDAVLAGVGAAVASGVMLFLTPLLERVFDVTTGMTLSELRDPRQPLLRQLQQQAPGTYNHSLNVATIAEAAADAIGADSLHLYVGALYHDVGKINKPDYFVENQTPGINRHDKLSPAMSLLVIMGHVKDGLELAREYKLPRSFRHYIESHHGETLVTYFYHQAKAAAEAENAEAPKEIEYRYPGPKPRTKEAAILMLCDAVEGATRAMSDPTSSRIATLVHDIATQRLEDGQFDDSTLTFAQLATVEDAITKTLSAIYHGRIKYPEGSTKKEQEGKEQGGKDRDNDRSEIEIVSA